MFFPAVRLGVDGQTASDSDIVYHTFAPLTYQPKFQQPIPGDLNVFGGRRHASLRIFLVVELQSGQVGRRHSVLVLRLVLR